MTRGELQCSSQCKTPQDGCRKECVHHYQVPSKAMLGTSEISLPFYLTWQFYIFLVGIQQDKNLIGLCEH